MCKPCARLFWAENKKELDKTAKFSWRLIKVKMLNSEDSPETIDLLDVCRVRECEVINRRLHRYAKVDRSFVVQTQDRVYLFETESKQEQGRVINGLKLVIARLALLLMLRDLRLLWWRCCPRRKSSFCPTNKKRERF
jgi:hypothetical protein